MVIKRILRDRRLTPEEGARYKEIREQVAAELPELVARHLKHAMKSDKADDGKERAVDEVQG
ncbi:MAG: hypothetical protein IAF94_26315 [Pirellulaceae bacterium]|nr:hypothetical protein [Pirellulaceae bacterium]